MGHFKLLLSLLGLEGGGVAAMADIVAVQRAVLRLLALVAASADCVADIAASQV